MIFSVTAQISQGPPPNDFEELDFEIVEEHWNEYEFPDGNRMKGRVFLTKLIRDPNHPDNPYVNISCPIWIVYAAPPNRGERNNVPLESEYDTLPKYEVMPTLNNERFNLYRIPRNGLTIRIKLGATRIIRIKDRFDNNGLPIYAINSAPVILIDPPPDTSKGQ